MERGERGGKIKERDRVVSLFCIQSYSCLLKRHQRQPIRSRKIIVRKPASGLKHVGQYSMPVRWMRQG